MQHRQIRYKNSSVSYYRFGSGPRIVLCFHGYGEDASLFSFLGKYGGDKYSFCALDLPFHGKTDWRDSLHFNEKDLKQIAEKIFADCDLDPAPGKGHHLLLGFSLGGRIALSLYQSAPELVKKLVLLAPDGLKVNFWYWLATQTWFGSRLFSFTMKYPGWFFILLKLLNKMGLVNSSVFKFVNFYIGKPAAREILYQRWTGLRKLRPDLARIKKFIRQYQTEIRLVYGKFDRIILPVRGEKFQKGIEEYCKIAIIDSGHQVVHEKHAEAIIKALNE